MSEQAPRTRRRVEEEVIWTGNPHWLGMTGWYLKWLGAAALITGLGYVGYRNDTVSGTHALLAALGSFALVLFIGWLIRRSTTYKITTKRVQESNGLLGRRLRSRKEEAPINRIDNVTIEQTLYQRLVGIGTIDFDTAGEREITRLRWWGVKNPDTVAAKIEYVQYGDEKVGLGYVDKADPRFDRDGYIEEDGR